MALQFKKILGNEDGFLLVAVIFLLMISTITGVYAAKSSNTECKIVRNEATNILEFYGVEEELNEVLENASGSGGWFNDNTTSSGPSAFVELSETEAYLILENNTGFEVKIRCIEDTNTPIDNSDWKVDDVANELPIQSHISTPPAGSGYSLSKFEARRYGITVSSKNTIVQVGVFKVFNRF